MNAPRRRFGALLSPDGVSVVEYVAERLGMRVVEEWSEAIRSPSIDEALTHLRTMLSTVGVRKLSLSIAVEQFGVLHHLVALPPSTDEILRPIVRREVQRVFGLVDPVVAFTRTTGAAQRDSATAIARNLFVAAAPRDMIGAAVAGLSGWDVDIQILTVVPKAIESLYQANGGALEPTAVLVCLDGGPQVSFFLDGRLELAIDPPIALEGEPPTVPVIVDQVERGTVYLRQQFRGATATRLLLAARPADYASLAAELERRLGVRVQRLFHGATSPEGVVAMGAVLEAQQPAPLDIFPHAPRLVERVRTALRGPNGVVAVATMAATIAAIWATTQLLSLASAERQITRLRMSLQANARAIEPSRQIVERRATFAQQVDFVQRSASERSALVATLGSIARDAPPSVRFDSLTVVRIADAWAATITGRTSGPTGAQAVRALDDFYRSMRGRTGIRSAVIDQFEYPSPADSMHHVEGDTARRVPLVVVVLFRLSLVVDRASVGSQ